MINHHALVFVLQVMAVNHVDLIAFVAVGKINRDTDGFSGPHQNGVFPPEIRHHASAGILRQLAHLTRAVATVGDLE